MQAKESRPLFAALGQGGALIPLLPSPSKSRGMARHKAHGLDFARPARERVTPGRGPERRAPGREASRPAPCGAPTRHLSFWPLTVVGPGRLVVAGEAARVRPGDEGCVSPWPAGAAPAPRLNERPRKAPLVEWIWRSWSMKRHSGSASAGPRR